MSSRKAENQIMVMKIILVIPGNLFAGKTSVKGSTDLNCSITQG
jgi:hypothetical protein